ncbi:MAG TPA: amidohydrolase family protein, partial [Acidimicrobiia bacterium]
MSETLLFRGGTIIDATTPLEGTRADVLVADGRVAEVGPALDAPAGALVLDASDAIVAPGLVDLQVHLREPGREEAETIETGSRAAALGGCTAVVCMPNTEPPLDDAAVVQSVLERGRKAACAVFA